MCRCYVGWSPSTRYSNRVYYHQVLSGYSPACGIQRESDWIFFLLARVTTNKTLSSTIKYDPIPPNLTSAEPTNLLPPIIKLLSFSLLYSECSVYMNTAIVQYFILINLQKCWKRSMMVAFISTRFPSTLLCAAYSV